ncbi:MAG: hypothetical protein ACKPKO_37590, partial [Candidatus Fonsibacter sp.]
YTWQSYKPEEPINNMSRYIVEANSFDLFFNKRYNLCYGFYCVALFQLLQEVAVAQVVSG